MGEGLRITWERMMVLDELIKSAKWTAQESGRCSIERDAVAGHTSSCQSGRKSNKTRIRGCF